MTATLFFIEHLQPQQLNRNFRLFQWRNLYVILCVFITALFVITLSDLASLFAFQKGFDFLLISNRAIELVGISHSWWSNLWQSCWSVPYCQRYLGLIILFSYPPIVLIIVVVSVFCYLLSIIYNKQIKLTEKLNWSLKNLKITFLQSYNDIKFLYVGIYNFCQKVIRINIMPSSQIIPKFYLQELSLNKNIPLNEAKIVFIYSIFDYIKNNKQISSLEDFEIEIGKMGFMMLFDEVLNTCNFSSIDNLQQELVKQTKTILLEKKIDLKEIYNDYFSKNLVIIHQQDQYVLLSIILAIIGIFVPLLLIPFAIPIYFLIRFLLNTPSEISDKTVPNQGIWNSLKYSLFSFVFCSVIFIILWLALSNQIFLLYGILSGLLVGLFWGGLATIQHVSLRIVLCISGSSPWNYVRFLNYATESLFMQKVGGGYIFIHRMLMEHFAQMKEDGKRT